jgi:hypothetical protein
MKKQLPSILQIGDILISSEILSEQFCCDLEVCKGQCCVEGDAGAPVTLDEIGEIEASLDACWNDLSASAQAVIDKQGVVYTDEEGDLVTSIVGGKDCVFTCYDDIEDFNTKRPIHHCCLCALEKAARAKTNDPALFIKPISCALYPIREKRFSDGTVALNFHRWKVCESAMRKGKELGLPVYRFLEGPLVRRFGQEWYNELCSVADDLKSQGYL